MPSSHRRYKDWTIDRIHLIGALQLPMNHRPIGFGAAPVALFGSPIGVERRL